MASAFLSQEDQQVLCRQLNELLIYSAENFNYYRDKNNGDYQNKIASLKDICNLPILERNHLMNSNLISEAIDKNPPTYFETSGTTGNPFPVLANFTNEKNQSFATAIDAWQSLKKDNVKRAIIALPFEMNPVGMRYHLALSLLGITSIPVGVRTHLCTPSKVLQIMERLKPELLIGRPLEILRYAEAMLLQNEDPAQSSIKKIIFTGEIVSPNKWQRMRKIYGDANVDGVFGLTELDSGGLISCIEHNYHLPPKPYLIVEVLKDDLKTSVTDGEMGTIILTNTEKNYLPLIRYNTGDKGILHTQCACGLATPAIQFMGRKSDCITVAHTEIYPIQIENILFAFDQVGSDYQILANNNNVTIRLEIKGNKQAEFETIENKIKEKLLTELGLPVTIQCHPFGKLANKLGIAKEKAGKLYVMNGLSEEEVKNKLKINYC